MKIILLLFSCLFISYLALAQENVSNSDKSLTSTAAMPRFPGCETIESVSERKICADQKLQDFIYSNLQYPKKAKNLGVEGIVVVSFTINSDGTVSDILLVRDVGVGLGEEALRIVRLMQEQDIRWIPGKNGDKSIPVSFSLPIKFRLK